MLAVVYCIASLFIMGARTQPTTSYCATTTNNPLLTCMKGTTNCNPYSATFSNPVQAVKYKYCYSQDSGTCCSDVCGVLDPSTCGLNPLCTWMQSGSDSTCVSFMKICAVMSYNATACNNLQMCQYQTATKQCTYVQPSTVQCPGGNPGAGSSRCGPTIPGYAVALMVLCAVAFVGGIAMIAFVIVKRRMKAPAEKKRGNAEHQELISGNPNDDD